MANPKDKEKPPFTNILLLWTFVMITAFTAYIAYKYFDSEIEIRNEPTTLIISVYTFFGVECGVMGWIKTNSDKTAKAKEETVEQPLNDETEE
ncbi:MAG: hypothetical protein FWD23_07255 [Oscillospiraceae bacterium]|nr:hypothetical protein [Oscillospiraceae bacterium]